MVVNEYFMFSLSASLSKTGRVHEMCPIKSLKFFAKKFYILGTIFANAWDVVGERMQGDPRSECRERVPGCFDEGVETAANPGMRIGTSRSLLLLTTGSRIKKVGRRQMRG